MPGSSADHAAGGARRLLPLDKWLEVQRAAREEAARAAANPEPALLAVVSDALGGVHGGPNPAAPPPTTDPLAA